MADNEPASAAPAPQTSQTLGQMLRNARLAQDLTIEQLSTELRIEARQLGALEDDRFEQIGVPVFVKGYLKQYGTRLGVNVADLLALYYQQTTLADVQIRPNRTIKLRDERQITSWVLAAVVLLAVVAGLAWWWTGGNLGALQLPRSTPVSLEPAAPVPAEPIAQRQPQRIEESPAAAPPVEAPVPEGAAGGAVAGDTAAAAPSDSSAASAATAFTAPDESDDEPSAALPLEFAFEQESWAEVTDARGERLLFGLNAAGRTVRVRGAPPIAIVLGNANGVRLSVNGEPYEIPGAGREGALARFSVNPTEE